MAKNTITITNLPEPAPGTLRRKDLVAIAVGQCIGTGLITLLGPAIGYTGQSCWLAYLAAFVLGFIMVLPKMFLSSALRVGGGNYSLCADLAQPVVSGIMTYISLVQAMMISMVAVALGTYVNEIFPGVSTQMVAFVAMVLFFGINMFGIDAFKKLNNIMCWVLIVSLVFYIIIGIPKITYPVFTVQPGTKFFAGGFKGFFLAAMLLFNTTQGYYFTYMYGRDCKNATVDCPRSMLLALPLIMVCYMGVTIVNQGVLPLDQLRASTLIASAKAIMPTPLFFIFIVGGPMMALLTTLNGSIPSGNYPIIQACDDGWLPKGFASANRFGAPWKILLFRFIVGCIPIALSLNISAITNLMQLLVSITGFCVAFAFFRAPDKYPEAWKCMTMKVSPKLYKFFVCLAFALDVITFIKSCASLSAGLVAGNLIATAAAVILGILAAKYRKISIVTSVWPRTEPSANNNA